MDEIDKKWKRENWSFYSARRKIIMVNYKVRTNVNHEPYLIHDKECCRSPIWYGFDDIIAWIYN
jgi:hypothetical protein